MKMFTDAALDALEDGTAIVSGAVKIDCDPPILVWGGYGPLTVDGEMFDGIGDRGLAQVSGGALGGSANAVTLSLSGLEAEVLELLDANEVRGAPVTLWRLIFDGTGTQLLDAQVFTRGRLDHLPVDETIGGTASISAMIETAARGLGRRGGRMRTDADQRLIKTSDGGFKAVSYAGQKTLYWGGKKPATAANAVGSGNGFGGGFLGGMADQAMARARAAN